MLVHAHFPLSGALGLLAFIVMVFVFYGWMLTKDREQLDDGWRCGQLFLLDGCRCAKKVGQ